MVLSLIGALALQLCLGSTYAWSALTASLQSECGIAAVEAQWVFGVRTAVFALTMFPVGYLLSRYGLRTTALVSSVIYGIGHLVPLLAPSSFAALLLGMGAFTGLGMGGGYLAALRFCATAWPDRKGLLIGLGAGAFGGGAWLASRLAAACLSDGMPVMRVFTLFGLGYGLICITASLLLPGRMHAQGTSSHPHVHDSATGPAARRLTAACFFAKLATNFAGLLVIGNLVPLACSLGFDTSTGVMGIAAFSFGNALGRVVWGALFDRWGRNVILYALLGLAGALVGIERFGRDSELFLLFTGGVGFCFGAGFVLYASLLTDVYGPLAVQKLYPMVFTAHGIAAVLGPPLGARLIASGQGSSTALLMASGTVLLGMVGFEYLVRRAGLRHHHETRSAARTTDSIVTDSDLPLRSNQGVIA